jgi:hypothetical protein
MDPSGCLVGFGFCFGPIMPLMLRTDDNPDGTDASMFD